MLLLITQFIFVLSLGGIVFLVVRKMPLILALPEVAIDESQTKVRFLAKLRKVVKTRPVYYNGKELDQKATSAIKIDTKTQIETDSNYWEDVGK